MAAAVEEAADGNNGSGGGGSLQINDIDPFCQDEIVLYRECAAKRIVNINWDCPCPLKKQRKELLNFNLRHMILASGIRGMEGFHQRWSLHGHLEDTELEALNQGIEERKAGMIQGEPKRDLVRKKWVFGRFCLLPCDFDSALDPLPHLKTIMLLILKWFYSSIHVF
ncbi:hypothetical protein MUK42_31653 [Musa troglodytarum]|uniref:DUF7803 domain-containing protein n=1 Tax=Musa troglodytarum TaxID=320322 RepID=A0A9E7FCT5_9LILI|nr:hypothetical protein MUK42_31653 [Musa troglodytarum]